MDFQHFSIKTVECTIKLYATPQKLCLFCKGTCDRFHRWRVTPRDRFRWPPNRVDASTRAELYLMSVLSRVTALDRTLTTRDNGTVSSDFVISRDLRRTALLQISGSQSVYLFKSSSIGEPGNDFASIEYGAWLKQMKSLDEVWCMLFSVWFFSVVYKSD